MNLQLLLYYLLSLFYPRKECWYGGKGEDSNSCTKVDCEEEEKNAETIVPQSGLLVNMFGGFIGSVIGTLTILFLYINEYLPIDLLKLK